MVQRLVGAFQRVLHGVSGQVLRQADGHGELQRACAVGNLQRLHGLADTFEQLARVVCRGVCEHQHKFLATPAGQHVGVAHAGAHRARKGLQRAVAGGVAVLVVDGLEVVDVQLRQQHRAATAQAAAVLQRHQVEHGAAVDEACQLVAGGQFAVDFERLGQRLALLLQLGADALDAQVQRNAAAEHDEHHQCVGCVQVARGVGVEARTDADGAGKGQQRIHANADHLGHREAKGAEEQDHCQHAGHQPACIARQHIGHRTAGDGPDHLRDGERGVAQAGGFARADEGRHDRQAAHRQGGPPLHCGLVHGGAGMCHQQHHPGAARHQRERQQGHAHQRAPPGVCGEDHILEALPADGWAQGGGLRPEGKAARCAGGVARTREVQCYRPVNDFTVR